MMNTNDPFFETWQRDRLSEHTEVFYARCDYNLSHYHDMLFSQEQFVFPAELTSAVIKRKSEFFAGRYCARSALMMIGVNGVTIGIGDKRQPLWPVGIKGAISHTHLSAICIVSASKRIKGIGVDQEFVLTSSLIDEISAQIISSPESEVIERVNLPYADAFTITFSAKESFFKAMFPIYGDYFDFDAVTLTHLTVKHGKGEFCLRLNLDFNQEFSRGKEVNGFYSLQGNIVETYVLLT